MKKIIFLTLLCILIPSICFAAHWKVWYEDSDPTVVKGYKKDIGMPGQSYFVVESSLVFAEARLHKDWYEIDWTNPEDPVLKRKDQAVIDAIELAKTQAEAERLQRIADARAEMANTIVSGMTYVELVQFIQDRLDLPPKAQVDTWMDSNVTDLAGAKEALKKLAKTVIDLAEVVEINIKLTAALAKEQGKID